MPAAQRPAGFDVVSSRVVYEGAFVRVRVDEVRTPDGGVVEREVVDQHDAVAAVPITGDGLVVLVRQYRTAFADYRLELPAGKLDVEDEQRTAAMRRELVEEVGFEADDLTELVTFDNSAGWTDERTTVYLATGLHEATPPDGFTAEAEEADMEVVRLPLEEAVAMAQRGEITDAKTLVGLLLAADHLAR